MKNKYCIKFYIKGHVAHVPVAFTGTKEECDKELVNYTAKIKNGTGYKIVKASK